MVLNKMIMIIMLLGMITLVTAEIPKVSLDQNNISTSNTFNGIDQVVILPPTPTVNFSIVNVSNSNYSNFSNQSSFSSVLLPNYIPSSFCYANGTNSSGVSCQTVTPTNPFNQTLNTSSNVTFNNLTLTGNISTDLITSYIQLGSPAFGRISLSPFGDGYIMLKPWTWKFSDDLTKAIGAPTGSLMMGNPATFTVNQTPPYLLMFRDGFTTQVLNVLGVVDFSTLSRGFNYGRNYNLGIGYGGTPYTTSDSVGSYFAVGRPQENSQDISAYAPFYVTVTAGNNMVVFVNSTEGQSFLKWFKVGDSINSPTDEGDGDGPYTITGINTTTMNISGSWVFSDTYIFATNKVHAIRIDANGRIRLNSASTTTSFLQLSAGNANANQNPLKFVSGTMNTVAEAGAVEYQGTDLYLTNTTAVRKPILTNDSNNNVFFRQTLSVGGKLSLGPSKSASLNYNGSDLLINPKELGTGKTYHTGDMVISNPTYFGSILTLKQENDALVTGLDIPIIDFQNSVGTKIGAMRSVLYVEGDNANPPQLVLAQQDTGETYAMESQAGNYYITTALANITIGPDITTPIAKLFIERDMNLSKNLSVDGNVSIKGNINITGNMSVKRPYLTAYDNTTQNFLSVGTAQVVNISNNIVDNWQINITGNQNITFQQTGDYLITFMPEFYQSSGTNKLINFWIQKNGVDVAWSNTQYTILNGAYLAPNIAFQVEITNPATDNIRVMWHSDSTNSQILSITGLTSPTRPNIPGVLLNVAKISEAT